MSTALMLRGADVLQTARGHIGRGRRSSTPAPKAKVRLQSLGFAKASAQGDCDSKPVAETTRCAEVPAQLPQADRKMNGAVMDPKHVLGRFGLAVFLVIFFGGCCLGSLRAHHDLLQASAKEIL
jgi:hypothetical protein